jgi:hypothetical protein
MRINLVTPFAEKDAVKALGARWDAANKCWYTVDVADLTPFMRWIPDMAAATRASTDAVKRPQKTTSNARVDQFKGPTTGTPIEVPHCGCNVLPWEDCVHTAKPTALAQPLRAPASHSDPT